MGKNRFYTSSRLECRGQSICIHDDEFLHLQVMRKRNGETIELINGRGSLASATITHISKKSACIVINDIITVPPETPAFTLVQAAIKPHKLKLIFQKCTELGVSHFIIFIGDRTTTKLPEGKQADSSKYVTINAIKQSGRLHLPSIEWYKALPPLSTLQTPISFGDPTSTNTPSSFNKPSTLIIGPEGGFSNNELSILRTQAQGVTLSKYTLKSETAAIAGSAIFLSQNE